MDKQLYEIYTDASFDNKTKIGTYSIVITKDKKVVKAFGKECKVTLEGSAECEIFAMFQAMSIIEGSLIKKNENQNFLLYTDFNGARDFFLLGKKKVKTFKKNGELKNKIRKTFKRIKENLNDECTFNIKWISRDNNKIAHKYSYSVLKKATSKEYKKNIAIFDRKGLLKYLKKFDSKKHKVLIYLHLIKNEEKIVIKTQKEIAKALELSNSYINKIFLELIKFNMLKKVKNGKYKLLL